jgi:hypothetical protein
MFEDYILKKRNRINNIIKISNEVSESLKCDVKKPHGQNGHKGYKRFKLSEVIERFKSIHGNRYDYSKVKYKNQITPITIICKEHGNFLVTPQMHWKKVGCQECKKKEKLNDTSFTRIVLEEKRDSIGKLIGMRNILSDEQLINREMTKKSGQQVKTDEKGLTKLYKSGLSITDISKKLGVGRGTIGRRIRLLGISRNFVDSCKNRRTTKEWITLFKETHGDRYDYSKLEETRYVDKSGGRRRAKGVFICKIHGEFDQRFYLHKEGGGCPKCGYQWNQK